MSTTLQELFDAGAHLGHRAEKWHPRMKQWIYGEQDGIHLFDLEKTLSQLEAAKKRIQQLKSEGKSVVVVATKKQVSEIVMNLAIQAGVMYVVNRWPGGLITNWDQVHKSIKKMNEIETGLSGDKYQDYTKYERLLLEKQLNRLKRLFGGLKELKNKSSSAGMESISVRILMLCSGHPCLRMRCQSLLGNIAYVSEDCARCLPAFLYHRTCRLRLLRANQDGSILLQCRLQHCFAATGRRFSRFYRIKPFRETLCKYLRSA